MKTPKISTNMPYLRNYEVEIYKQDNTREVNKIPEWARTVILAKGLGVFMPVELFTDDSNIAERCNLEGAGMIYLDNHLFADTNWLRKNYRKNKNLLELIDTIELGFSHEVKLPPAVGLLN